MTIRALFGEVGGWHLRGLLSQALMMLLHRRLAAIRQKMERLVVRYEAGTLVRRVPRPPVTAASVPATGETVRRDRKRGEAVRLWPGRVGWLVRVGTWRAASYGCQVEAVLRHPEMVALLTAAPQAGRILLPLCRMLAVDTSLLRPWLPPRPVAEAGPKMIQKRVRAPRKKIDWGRIPLPRGVLSAVRRQGFGKLR